jgi:hypothetical protein
LTLERLVLVDTDCGLARRRFANDRYHTIPQINQEGERAFWAGGIVIPENPDDGAVRVGEGATFGKPIIRVEFNLLRIGGSYEAGDDGQAYPEASLAPISG